jgi:hypothetical protein
MTNRITEGPAWLETLLHYYVLTPWRSIYEWTIITVLAFIVAVALLATFQPLYNILQWKGLL